MATHPPPLVSVVVPNYNYAHFLKQRLRSIFDQSFQDFEVLYLDDASTDESTRVLNDCLDEWNEGGRVRIYPSETNSGNPFRQWNKGVAEAKGEFVWLAEADDYAAPELLQRLVTVLEENPSIGIAYCQSWAVDENEQVLHSMQAWTDDLDPTRWHSDFVNDGRDECSRFLTIKNTIPNASGVLFRRDVFLHAGGAEQGLRICGDWMTWVKMLLISDVAFIAEPLNFFRHHSSTVRKATELNAQRAEESYRVLKYILEQVEVEPKQRELACRRFARDWLDKVIHLRAAPARRRSSAIYRLARDCDPHLHRRILKEGSTLMLDRISAKAQKVVQSSR